MKTKNSLVDSYSKLYTSAKSVSTHHSYVYALLIALMIGIGSIRIISTYNVFWQTWDEPFHIAAGLEWLDKGTFTYEPYHPPLARVMIAIGPYLNGVRIVDGDSIYPPIVQQGNAILYTGDMYERNLALARLGTLPFFIVASVVVALWGKEYGGTLVSLLGTFLFTSLPPILAHSGFATLDMACASLVAVSLYFLVLWIRKPTMLYSILMGVIFGLTALTKLQALGFLLVAGILTLAVFGFDLLRKKRLFLIFDKPRLRQWFVALTVVLLFFTLSIWAGYRFSVGYLLSPDNRPHERIDQVVGFQGSFKAVTYFVLENMPIPAPGFVNGVQDFFTKNNQGHLDYFMGEIRRYGWWYYFPIIFLLKTPLPFIALSAYGGFSVFRNAVYNKQNTIQLLIPVVCSLGVLFVGAFSKHSNGIRQILSIYPFLAILAGYGVVKLMSINKKKEMIGLAVASVLILWQLTSSVSAHPDYLAYFNELASKHPEKIAVDSDLDWGQDLKRLSLVLKEYQITDVKLQYHGSVGLDLSMFDFPSFQELKPYKRESGWVAISIYSLTLGTGQAPYDQYSWLREYDPVERIGESIFLYNIPGK